ncbi:MAG: RNase J family beta-CASP ribonuclease [Tenericutes bacterium GWC2_34_14]|nr:MAG: RNase J family beta-CASP ribonuclease [Tenericutes bacterium GWA2_35_7]OHE29641.1 MAG: RNase J family beta-CASP ribonuclease [Tenericutes bacterium GWC2_34_14]OHE34221.1 MAG: RNase J family beta-CASP ribonuclease [Tenericutes bacterium GWE2_34_108]OHE35552.1 MAG: RNase J family beta-CASP ribonuclease [Tenericutes bacterium GWF1_35_14]OHE38529.1 MAG: RNase J family beta-CASP ribonuclease [Tenericutes bacterium GWF2_35_184]OHE43707.1 MAG: RNase J family beta-CASP ribonuclease [Tenericute
MSKIRFFALGGLGENGKNMYVVEVDQAYFILDAGIKYPSAELYGVDEIIPDYRVLIRVKDKIKGIFLSHAHEDHIAALPHLLKDLNVPVYATNFTMQIVMDMLKDEGYLLDTLTLNTISQNSIIKFGNVRVTFFNTTHSIPESVGIAIHTIDGVIVYTSDFTFDQSSDIKYQTDFRKINELSEKNVLALLTESLGSTLELNGGVNMNLNHRLNSIYANADGRIIVSLFSSDLRKIQRTIDISLAHKKKIAIIGRRAQRIVDIAIHSGYLTIPEESLINLRYVDEKNKNDGKDIVALVTGNRHEPFFMLQRMCKKADRLIHITEEDTVILMTPPVPGTEKMAARTLDVLFRSDAQVKVIDKRLLTSAHATAEEIKMMMNLLKPQYIIPTIGEYRHQYGVKRLAIEIGYKPDKVFLLDNGDVLTFDEKDVYVAKNDINVGEILIDGTAVGDVNDFVMKDRELLAEDGALLLVAHVSPKTKQILGEVHIVTKGFVYVQESEQLLNKVKETFMEVSKKHLEGKYINWNDYKRDVRNEVNRYIYQETRRSPITIPVIISTEQNG